MESIVQSSFPKKKLLKTYFFFNYMYKFHIQLKLDDMKFISNKISQIFKNVSNIFISYMVWFARKKYLRDMKCINVHFVCPTHMQCTSCIDDVVLNQKFIVMYCKCQLVWSKCFLLKSHIKYHLLVSPCSFRSWFLPP